MKVQEVAIEKLKPYWRNPRKRTKASIRKIADSIATFGWQQPIVTDKGFTVIIGHGRLEAAKLLEQKRVPVVIASGLTAEKVKALRIADNRVNAESDWDAKALLAEIADLKHMNIDVALTGLDGDDLKALADDLDADAIAAIETAPKDSTPFTQGEGDGDDDAEADDAEPAKPSPSKAAPDPESDDALVSMTEVVSVRQRTVINAAMKSEMAREKLERRGDALFSICERSLEDSA